MSALDVIRALAATASKNEKEAIVTKAYHDKEWEFFKGASLAYNVLITFGVATVQKITEQDDEPGTFLFEDFMVLATKLQNRELTGHAARDAIIEAAQSCHVDTWNLWYRKVLLKDLSVGITEGTINRALKKIAKTDKAALNYIVPVFVCQLAHNGDLPEHKKFAGGVKMLDIKLDGTRMLAILNKEQNTVTLNMRDGKINDNFPHITAALMKILNDIPGSIVLDGEIVMESFQELMRNIKKKGADTSQAKLALFDIIPLTDFQSELCAIPQKDRHAILSEMETGGMFSHSGNSLYVIPKQTVDLNTTEGRATLEEFNRATLAAGLEGVMLKDPDAPYEGKRSRGWLKMKPKISVTLKIVGFELGDPEGKHANRLGAWLCEGEDDGFPIKTKCGGGISDKDRDEYWENRDSYLGFMIEVEGDKLTLNEDGLHWGVRFPVMKGFRGTVPGEKL